MKLLNSFRKKENTQLATWQPLGVPRAMLTSARHHHGGQPHADFIMAVDDVSVDLVNIDQVNGSTRATALGQLGPDVSHAASLTSRAHTSGWV